MGLLHSLQGEPYLGDAEAVAQAVVQLVTHRPTGSGLDVLDGIPHVALKRVEVLEFGLQEIGVATGSGAGLLQHAQQAGLLVSTTREY